MKQMKGVSCIKRGSSEYWSAQIDGRKLYCGKGDKGKKMAEAAKAKHIARQYEDREAAVGLKVRKVELKTINALSNWYMTRPSIQEKKGYRRKIFASAHLLNHLGHKSIMQFEVDHQEDYREVRKKEGAADGTIDVEIQLLRAMFNLARKRKKILPHTMPGEFIIKKHTNPRPRVTDKQYNELLNHADQDFKDVLVCGYESAMRSDEIATLTARQVKLDVTHISGQVVDYIDLGIFDTKTGARRTVPVSPTLKEVLKRRLEGLEPEDYVFKNNGRRFSNFLISAKMNRLCNSIDIPHGDKVFNKKGEKIGIVFHSLRHTRISKWVESGLSDEIIRRASGHKSLSAYQQYIKLDPLTVMRLVKAPEENNQKTGKTGIKTAESPVK